MNQPKIVLRILLAALAAACGAAVSIAQEAALPFVLGGGGRSAPLPLADGKAIYEHVCQSCHMVDARGGDLSPARYPALAANPKLTARAYPALMVINGLGAMPGFGSLLTDDQIAAVVNYLRSNFGNSFADPLPAAEVRSLRPAVQAAPAELRGR